MTKLPVTTPPNGSTTPSILDDPSVFTALGDSSLKSLKTVLRGVLPQAGGRVCARIAKLLHLMAAGQTFRAASDAAGIRWAELSYWIHEEQRISQEYRPLHDLYELAKSCQAAVLQHQREDALHKRGVEGWSEPIIYRGVEVGTVQRYSDRCLEIALKAAEPDKYSDRHQAAVNLDVAIVFQEMGVPAPESQRPTIDVTGHIRDDTPDPAADPQNPRPNPRPIEDDAQNASK